VEKRCNPAAFSASHRVEAQDAEASPGAEGINIMDPKRKLRDETGSDAAGQSGDIQQLRDRPYADSESAEELLEEGNAFEAGIVSGVEDAPDPDADEGGIRTREVPEDDVPEEYLDNDR
jgi:hypothetical protein